MDTSAGRCYSKLQRHGLRSQAALMFPRGDNEASGHPSHSEPHAETNVLRESPFQGTIPSQTEKGEQESGTTLIEKKGKSLPDIRASTTVCQTVTNTDRPTTLLIETLVSTPYLSFNVS